jgi:outer membrane cobalamin receptor
MTDRAGAGVFVTLTRTAYPEKSLPFNTQSARADDFRPYDPQNVGDAIAHLTSISIDPTGSLGATRLAGIRGASSNQTLVLIDGRPVGGVALSGSQDLAEIPVEQVDHIEIVRGGVSALYGPNAIGGVINVITKRAQYSGLPITHVGFESRSYGNTAYRLDFGSRLGRFDYYFFGDQQRESGFRTNSDATTYNVGGNVGVSMGKAGKLLFDFSSYHAEAGQAGQIFPDLPVNQFNNEKEKPAVTPDSRQQTTTNYLRSSYLLPLPMNSLATFRLFGSQRQTEFQIPSFFVNSDRHEQSKGGEAQVALPLGFLAGGTFIHDRLDSTDFITPTNSYIASVENYGFFLQDEMKWKMLTLIPSGRFDHNSQAGESKNPRVQLIADATDWLRFSGSAARSFRAPTIDDLFTPFTDFGGGFSYVGNLNLRPERAWTYDAGFEVHAGSCSFRAGYFRANITDLIQTTPDLASTSINVGKAKRQGAEIEIHHFVNDYFRDSWNYTYLENVGIPQGFTTYVPLRLSARHTANYIATISPIAHMKIDNTLSFRGSRYEGNDNTNTKLPSTLLWDLRFAYEIRQMEFYIGASDITNKRYEDRSGFPLAGRAYFGGVNLRLWG